MRPLSLSKNRKMNLLSVCVVLQSFVIAMPLIEEGKTEVELSHSGGW